MLGLVVSAFFGLQLALHLNLLDKMTEHASSAEHAQLVQRVEEHMAVHGVNQAQVAKALQIS